MVWLEQATHRTGAVHLEGLKLSGLLWVECWGTLLAQQPLTQTPPTPRAPPIPAPGPSGSSLGPRPPQFPEHKPR